MCTGDVCMCDRVHTGHGHSCDSLCMHGGAYGRVHAYELHVWVCDPVTCGCAYMAPCVPTWLCTHVCARPCRRDSKSVYQSAHVCV